MNDVIIAAMDKKKVISFTYSKLLRIVEPHVYGINDREVQILGYQIRGNSNSGDLPNWRRFNLSAIQNLEVLDESFPGPREPPSGQHSKWDQIIFVVE